MSRHPDLDRTTNAPGPGPLTMFEQNKQTPGKVSEGPRLDSFALLSIRVLTAYVEPIRDMFE